jgi:hypothetical protein
MKYAYISAQEPFSLGVRIVQVQDTKNGLVDVPPDLFWIECNDDVNTIDFYYDMESKEIKLAPTPE